MHVCVQSGVLSTLIDTLKQTVIPQRFELHPDSSSFHSRFTNFEVALCTVKITSLALLLGEFEPNLHPTDYPFKADLIRLFNSTYLGNYMHIVLVLTLGY